MRAEKLKKLQTETFDLLVVGGGITGVGIALDAQSRGLKVALVEKSDFAAGTSSRSTKLIHGGLRYLKQFEFKLVNEVGRERAVLHKLAPHLVHPDKMLLPLVKDGNYGKFITSIGLSVYDWLAGVKSEDKRKMLTKSETAMLEPLLRTDVLEGGGFYAEYRTDDSRMVMAVAQSAQNHGALLANYVSVQNFIKDADGKITGVNCSDELTAIEGGANNFTLKSKTIVNACGPWVDELRQKDGSMTSKHLYLTKGIHLVVAREKLPIRNTVYFDNEDGRMLFAVPRGRAVYLGTTDTAYKGKKENPSILKQDVSYVLAAVNAMFPSAKLLMADVESSWAGLRPLIHEEGKSPSEMSRKDEIFLSESGLVSIAGGKLTGFRKMSERVVDIICQNLGKKLSCKTENIKLFGSDFETYGDVLKLIDRVQKANSFEPHKSTYLVQNYGSNTLPLLEDVAATKPKIEEQQLILAELHWAVENEMVETSLDFWDRRTGRLNFDIESVMKYRDTVHEFMKTAKKWSPEMSNWDQQNLDSALHVATNFV